MCSAPDYTQFKKCNTKVIISMLQLYKQSSETFHGSDKMRPWWKEAQTKAFPLQAPCLFPVTWAHWPSCTQMLKSFLLSGVFLPLVCFLANIFRKSQKTFRSLPRKTLLFPGNSCPPSCLSSLCSSVQMVFKSAPVMPHTPAKIHLIEIYKQLLHIRELL